jgi:hypothetical protein
MKQTLRARGSPVRNEKQFFSQNISTCEGCREENETDEKDYNSTIIVRIDMAGIMCKRQSEKEKVRERKRELRKAKGTP